MTHLELVKWQMSFYTDLIKRTEESNNKLYYLLAKELELTDKLQAVYLKWHKGHRPMSGFLDDIEKTIKDAGYIEP